MSLSATRIRHVSSKELLLAEQFISSLPFKVELKGISFDGTRWVIHFVLPEYDGLDLASVDL